MTLPFSKIRSALAVAAAAVLSACAVGPDYTAPAPVVSPTWQGAANTSEPRSQWWRTFGDPLLDKLVTRALEANKDLAEADARLREARATKDAVRGRQAPQVGASASTMDNRLSANGQLPVGRVPGLGRDLSLYDAGFDAAWEIDLWGGLSRAEQAADARLGAASEARHAVTLQVIAEVIRAYLDLRTAQALKATTVEDAKAQAQLAEITRQRLRAGEASRFDLTRAEALAKSTASAIPGYEADASTALYRLALLIGQAPEAGDPALTRPAALPVTLPSPAIGLRSDLLRRRPDVRLAERELAAATADIGVATADLFPRLSLIGAVGVQARDGGELLSSESLRFSYGPSLRWPIFSGGRIRAQIRASDARAQAAAVRYERAVLVALSDSETALNRYAAAQETARQRQEAARIAQEAVELARRRYQGGEEDLTAVLQAQTAFSALDRQAVAARAAEAQHLTSLYKALGGGWEARLAE